MPRVERLLTRCREKCFLRIMNIFCICGVILGISNVSFHNSMHWMNKGYNVEQYNLDKLNFPLEKDCIATSI